MSNSTNHMGLLHVHSAENKNLWYQWNEYVTGVLYPQCCTSFWFVLLYFCGNSCLTIYQYYAGWLPCHWNSHMITQTSVKWPNGVWSNLPVIKHNEAQQGQNRVFLFMFFLYCEYINLLTQSYLVSPTRRYHTGKMMVFKKSNTLPNVSARFVVGCGLIVTWYRHICPYPLTHWGRVTHIWVGNVTITGSGNGLPPGRGQAIIWTNAGILLIGPLGTNFSEISVGIQTFSFRKMHLEMSSALQRLFRLALNELSILHRR